jgi:iron uptake system component EfeO
MRRTVRGTGVAFILVAGLVLAACSSKAAAPDHASTKITDVDVELVTAGCRPIALSVPAGAANFSVTNTGAKGVNEFEIHAGANILAEAELVNPGVTKTFAITLPPGKFTTVCKGVAAPGGTGTLTVTGQAKPAPSGASAQAAALAVAKYRAYLETQADLLVTNTTAFVHAIQAGNIAQAKTLYAPARIPYERIEPVSESFGDLDPRIDARVNDVPVGHWSGFHRIERALYEEDDVTAMGPTAAQLLVDVTTLDHLVRTVRLEPATIANGAVELLNEVTTSKISGEEERYSHIDLVDLAANVEGSQAAFDAVAPLLPPKGVVSASEIDGRFSAIFRVLQPFRRGSGYVLYDELNTTDTRSIAQATDATAEPLSRVAVAIIG